MRLGLRILLSILFLGSAAGVRAQTVTKTTGQLVDIALNGAPVTIDGELDDWMDAQFIFLSQDKVNFLQSNGNPIQGVPTSPADFSGYFAMKMDADNVYFAVKVRDEGTPMIETPATPNLAFVYDHLSVYLGLYDIGDLAGSPHVEIAQFKDPVTGEFGSDNIRTYRIGPGTDDQTSTLGPDYQMLIRAIPYADGTTGDDVQTYNGALVDTTIANTTAASDVFVDNQGGTGYTLEWKVPFASLAGKIAKSVPRGNFEWPLFTPAHGMVIPFDADITDLDDGDSNSGGATRFLRLSNNPALWQYADRFGMRGALVEGGNPVGVAVEDGPPGSDALPQTVLLAQNYPNPFNPVTRIAFALPQSQTVRLAVYDVMGREVAVLLDGRAAAGRTEVSFDASGLPSGLYLYRLETPSRVETRRMVFLK